jgi:hypothetical protein
MNIKNLSKFGRSFSLLRIPYSFKLLIQELQVMNIQMRIITDENVDQLLSMSYSNNINKLLHSKDDERNTENTDKLIKEYVKKMTNIQSKSESYIIDSYQQLPTPLEQGDIQSSEKLDSDLSSQGFIIGEINTGSKVKIINGPYTGQIGTVNRIVGENCEIILQDLRKIILKKTDIELYNPTPGSSPQYAPVSPPYAPGSNSPQYAPVSPPYAPVSPPYAPGSSPPSTEALGSESPIGIPEQVTPDVTASILEVPKESEEKKELEEVSSSSDSGDKKVIDIPTESSSDISTSSGTKKITI